MLCVSKRDKKQVQTYSRQKNEPVFQNRTLRRLRGPKREETGEECTRMHR